MITAYLSKETLKPELITAANNMLLHEALWIDLLLPSKEEEILIEEFFNINIPPREEMQGIEPSSRLYKEKNSVL